VELSSIRTRLLELYLEELRKRERLTGSDRITLYHQFQRVLELDQLTKEAQCLTSSRVSLR